MDKRETFSVLTKEKILAQKETARQVPLSDNATLVVYGTNNTFELRGSEAKLFVGPLVTALSKAGITVTMIAEIADYIYFLSDFR